MISFFESSLNSIAIHRIGNKSQDEHYILSEQNLFVEDEQLNSLLMHYFSSPYEKVHEIYRFYHPSENLDLNEIFHFVTNIFNDNTTFLENSQQIAKHLYEVSGHPKIKPGEVYVVLFRDAQIEGELHDAVGIFKSESRESYLKVYPEKGGFGMTYEQDAISINKLDKGVIIFNTEKEEGYKVGVVDQSGRNSDPVYWKDDFLKLKIRNDSYHQTSNVLGVYKNYVTNQIDEEFDISKADKIDLLNRSMKYFKEKETFDMDEFSSEVIGNPQGIESFKKFKEGFENEFETPIADSFDISDAAVKKQAKVYKSVLKLDKNFHIYIHGNKELIEKGFDDGKGMNFYKVFFKEEQ